MKIGFATNDWSHTAKDVLGQPVIGGSGYVRIGQYIKPLRDAGYSVAIGILANDRHTGRFGVHSWDGVTSFDCDVIVMQRYMHMEVVPDIKKAQSAGQIVLQDVDDWYWGLSEKNYAKKASDPNLNKDENINWYKNIIETSDGIITSTPFLQDKISQWNPNCVRSGNYVTLDKFTAHKEHKNVDDKYVLGWMGSTAHRSGDLQILKPYVKAISKFATWHHTGHLNNGLHPNFWSEIGVAKDEVTTHPFVAPHQLQDGIMFDVGVVPLTNIAFNHAKSYIKGLEYAAACVPFVASWSPQYEYLVEECGIGEIAKSPKDYVQKLKKYRDVEYRQEIADTNRKRVKRFDIGNGVSSLLAAIKKLVKEAR